MSPSTTTPYPVVASENVVRSLIKLEMSRKNYHNVIELIKNGSFKNVSDLTSVWDEAHYELKRLQRGVHARLSNLMKFRVRQKYPPPPSISINGTRISCQFSSSAKLILRNWFLAHIRDPYPSMEEKAALARKCGLNITQVRTWFANTRRRYKSGGSFSIGDAGVRIKDMRSALPPSPKTKHAESCTPFTSRQADKATAKSSQNCTNLLHSDCSPVQCESNVKDKTIQNAFPPNSSLETYSPAYIKKSNVCIQKQAISSSSQCSSLTSATRANNCAGIFSTIMSTSVSPSLFACNTSKYFQCVQNVRKGFDSVLTDSSRGLVSAAPSKRSSGITQPVYCLQAPLVRLQPMHSIRSTHHLKCSSARNNAGLHEQFTPSINHNPGLNMVDGRTFPSDSEMSLELGGSPIDDFGKAGYVNKKVAPSDDEERCSVAKALLVLARTTS